jgi:hypothetical protein
MVEIARRQSTCARVSRVLLLAFAILAPASAEAQTILVPAGGDFQAALDAVQPGGTVLLEAGATFIGKFTVPAKSNPDGLYITIRSWASDVELPPAGVRITPAYADRLPKIQSSDTLQAINFAPGASYWRLQCLEFLPNVNGAGDIVRVGSGSETIAANQPHHIVLERLYVHGDPTIGQKNGVVAHAAEFTLRDSYVSDIKLPSVETHAFASYNGPGPYLLENNYLEAASINIMFGGTDPKSVDLLPSDITIRRNHVAKNLQWMQPRPDGTYWNVKNLLELKVGRRVRIEGNVFENNWFGASDQSGYAVLLRSESQSGTCGFCETGPVTFENNVVRHAPAGFSLIGLDYSTTPVGVRMHDVVIRNNLFDDINRNVWYVRSSPSTVRFALVNGVDGLTFDHNTLIMPSQSGVVAFGGATDSTEFVFTNNMSEHKLYGVKGDGTAVGAASLAAYAPGYTFAANVLAGGSASSYPAGNYFPSVSTWTSEFVDYAAGDYRLKPSSVYRGVATDGTDLGADIARIEAAIGSRPNAAPTADDQSVTAPEDTAVPVMLTASDPDGDPLTYRIAAAPAHGTLSGAPPQLTYTGVTNYSGPDSFTFAVDDGAGGSSTAVVTMTITPVNDAPVARDQHVTTPQDTAIRFTLDASDPDGDPLTYDVPGSLLSGTLTQVAGATYEYVPNPGFAGTDAFVFTASDGAAAATATVTLEVTGSAITITTTSLADARVGRKYQQNLKVSGGTAPYAWSVGNGSLPPGLTLAASTGRITGTPSTAGTYFFDVQVVDGLGRRDSQPLSVRVLPAR